MTSRRPPFTAAAEENIAATGADWTADLHALQSGTHTEDSLLEHCLDGAEVEYIVGWFDYVEALQVSK